MSWGQESSSTGGLVGDPTLPLVLGALLAIRKERWILGLCLILSLPSVASWWPPLLVNSAIGASVAGERVWPWLVGACTWAEFFMWYAAEVLPRLADRGFERPLIDPSGIPSSCPVRRLR